MVLWGHNQLNVPSKMIIATTSMIILMILGTLSCEELMDADIDKTDNADYAQDADNGAIWGKYNAGTGGKTL